MTSRFLVFLAAWACACGSSTDQGDAGNNPDTGTGNDTGSNDTGTPQDGQAQNDSGGDSGDSGGGNGKVIFVIPLENRPQTAIYKNTTDAPYINTTLLATYAYTSNFNDELPALDSEPHYIWMESGTNIFTDNSFTTDNDSSPTNSTTSTAHLAAQLETAKISWTSYQEGMTAGTCPIASVTAKFYAAKHNPFVFFDDIVGNPPDAKNALCIAHHKPLTSLSGDLMNSAVSTYNFVTPSLCNDMHGDAKCPQANTDSANIKAGDDWLKTNLPPIIAYALAHDGYVFLTWDEGDASNLIPFIAIGKHSIAMHQGSVKYTHSSLLKSEEEILGLPILSSVTTANDFADLFDTGTFP